MLLERRARARALYSIITTQDFLIGVNWVVAGIPFLGYDTDTICHSWDFWTDIDPTGIFNHADDRNHMIRAVVETDFVGGIRVPVDKFGLLAPYIALASTMVVATVAVAIFVKHVKRRKQKP